MNVTHINYAKTMAVLGMFVLVGCTQPPDDSLAQPLPAADGTIILENQGGNMEGHTPRGFQGMGTGLFTGDNLNPNFPEGDGVQLFLTFDLSGLPAGEVASARGTTNKLSGKIGG